MAGVVGIEPTLTESKSVVLPLHYTPTNKTGYLLCDGLEAVAQPLSDFPIRKKLESNQRVINDVAASILNWYPWLDSNLQPADFKSTRTTN